MIYKHSFLKLIVYFFGGKKRTKMAIQNEISVLKAEITIERFIKT